jgi:ethanolamine permease
VLAVANGAVDFAKLFDIAADPDAAGSSTFLPMGWLAILYALPFAMWFFLGIEELPLAAEEAHEPSRDIPKAGIWGMITLVACGAIVFFLNPAVTGSEALGSSDEPLLDGFRAFLPDNLAALLSAFALIGLLASLQGIMYAYGRNMYSLSRAGYYPKSLSLTGARQTPFVALVTGAVIGFVALLIVNYNEGAGDVVLNIAVWGAVLAYGLQMISFLLLRRRFPNARRPWVSPTGNAGAIVALVIAAITFVGVLINPSYRPAVIAIVIFYVIGLLVFGFYGRYRLVLSPEEEYAVTGGLHGYDPEAEGLGGTIEDEILKGHTE